MDNFRRRSSAKKQRTVVRTYTVVDSFVATNVNITNGTFRINASVGSTADLSITITYTATTHLQTVYSDGTVENSNTTTSSGTCIFTKATVEYDAFLGWGIDISNIIMLSNGQSVKISLWEVPFTQGNDHKPIMPPSSQGGEVRYNCEFNYTENHYGTDYDVKMYIAYSGDTYYVNIYK